MSMDDTAGTKFGDLQNDQRYKRLERNLKLEYVKQIERIKAGDKDYCSSPIWPSSSSISPDGLDSSTNVVPSLQVSRIHSEVVSSSSNLRNVLSMQKPIRKPMATSSVKKFPVSDFDSDRAMMPPPPIGNCILRNEKRSTASVNSKYNPEDSEDYKTDVNIKTQDAPMKISSDASLESDCPNSKAYRVFSRWRVIINDHDQLIIKGTLECGKVARSKPVIQRFSNTKVQSIYKHIYVLEGNLVDDRNELPDYIRGKFYNGFPDDWENIYQLWRNYIAEGCKITFRWPTPISDSDDDINSEITDFVYNKNKQTQFEQPADFSKSLSNNGSSLGYHSKNQSDNQNLEKLKEKLVEDKTSETQTHANKKVDDSGHSSEKDISACGEYTKENCNKDVHSLSNSNSNTSLKNANYLYEIIHEDKLRIILSNLGDKDCPPQYLDKFIELVDCLRYMLSYTPNSNKEMDNKKQSLSPTKSETQGCQKCNRTASFSETQESNTESKANDVESEIKNANIDEIHQNTEKDECCQTEISHNKENYMQFKSKVINSAKNIIAESDNETYMGIAHIPLNHLMKSKLSRGPRYRNVKCHNKDRRNVNNDEEVKEQLKDIQDRKFQNFYDSSISITDDEYEKKHLQKENQQANKPLSFVLDNNKGNIEMTNRYEANNEYINTKSYGAISTSSPSKTAEKNKKPIIKSNELVHLDLKIKKSKSRIPADSDISVIDEASTLKQDLTNFNSKKNSIVNEKLSDNLLQHPFLTYDSEDISMDEDKPTSNISNCIPEKTNPKIQNQEELSKTEIVPKVSSPSKLKKVSSNENKIGKSEVFGSKENPKLLKSWVPCVMYDDEFRKKYSLKFEGILLNEAEHVFDRKYVTDSIQKRHSPKLLETVNNEYIMLVGEINNTKHIIPKELVRLCRTGCPARIKEFCEEWKKFKPERSNSKIVNLHEASIDSLTIATSSRGRRIVPPLNYWNGERIKTIGYDTVYDPGNEYKVVPIQNEGSKRSKILSPEKTSKDTHKKEASLKNSKNYIHPPDPGSDSDIKNKQKRIAEQLTYTSNSDSEKDEPRNKRALRKPKEPLNEKLTADSQPQHLNVKLRKRQRVDYKENDEQHRKSSDVRVQGSTRKGTIDLKWTYTKKQPSQDVLSDDQASIIIK